MREIKFRAWDKKEKRMYHFNDYWIDNEHQSMAFMIAEPQSGLYCLDFDEHDLSEPMQYTGLKDKAGKEIYEGDIVETEVMMFIERVVVRKTRLYIVGRDSEDPHLWLKGEDYGYEGEELISPDDIAVVGNIYENSELLQGIDDSATDVHSNSNY